MKKPNPLIQLLDELKELSVQTSVVTVSDSACNIYLTASDDPVRLSAQEVELLFDSPETVEQLFQALDEPSDAAIELHSVVVEPEVQEALERLFAAVDEF